MTVSTPAIDRFNDKYEQIPFDTCWHWTGARTRDGYGQIYNGDKVAYAHRWSYQHHIGPIPPHMCVCHTCDNPSCVNPAHLFSGSHQDNMDDMMRKDRSNRPVGETNGNAKLTWPEVHAVHYLWALGLTQTYLAAVFGVRQAQISRICNGKTWKTD